MAAWHLADIWENVARAVPDEPAIVQGDRRYSWREYEDRAARLAQVYTGYGLKPGAKIALYAHNCAEYMEAQFAAFKARLCPINVNYRYLEDELVYIIENSDSEALVFQARFAPVVAAIRDRIPGVKLFLQIDDGSGESLDGAVDYEGALAAADPMPAIERSEDDIYMLYTGGTTGMPKGVMYDHKTFAGALMGRGFEVLGLEPPAGPDDFGACVLRLQAAGMLPKSIPACPLMHGTGMWIGAMIPHAAGGAVILFDNRHFDPDPVWQLVEKEKASDLTIVGDVFAKPLLAALDAAKERGEPYDTSSLTKMSSSGVMWSAENKAGLLEHMNIAILDSIGATEGSMGVSVTTRENVGIGQTAKFELNDTTKILTEDGREVEPGSGEKGLICNGGMVPLGYYKDEKKSAATFPTFDGVRYSITGDYATIEADGTITLLGRGSICINSGGEKIFPEEVEEALKTHDSVNDCLVVGVPDDRFGERVTAVISASGGGEIEPDTLKNHVRGRLADYKAPRGYVMVDTVPRAANGKPDYKGAKAMALAQTSEMA